MSAAASAIRSSSSRWRATIWWARQRWSSQAAKREAEQQGGRQAPALEEAGIDVEGLGHRRGQVEAGGGARLDLEKVAAGHQARIGRPALGAGLHPVPVDAREPVAQVDLAAGVRQRRRQLEGQVAVAAGDAEGRAGVAAWGRLAVDLDPFDQRARLVVRPVGLLGSADRHAAEGRQVQPAVRAGGGSVAEAGDGAGVDAVETIEERLGQRPPAVAQGRLRDRRAPPAGCRCWCRARAFAARSSKMA